MNKLPAFQDAMDAREALDLTIKGFKAIKPKGKSELARVYAVTITDLEKALGYFETYAVRPLLHEQEKTIVPQGYNL